MTKKDTFFVTTPIYYTNGIPHIGHAYSSLIADSIARYQKISGKKVKFSTWVDENSQKALDKAEEEGMEIESYLDKMADSHKAVWDWLKIDYTDFIRTTDELHHKLVKEVMQKSFDNWDIYEGEYEGMYCVGCESFKKDEDLVFLNKEQNVTFPISDKVKVNDNIIKVCPDHLKTPDTIKEKNYFFKLSKYQKWLEEFYEENPEFIQPSDRFNEVKAFVSRWLEDFSISRETNKFGIKLPFDESQVSYVWYDALFNYVTVTTPEWEEKQCSKCPKWHSFWPADLHVVWKDIIRFHWIYWPAMLKSAGYELPKKILTTGFFTVDWQKISKSLWNAIDPVEFSEKYSKDLLTLYLLSSFNIGQDWDFDQKQAVLTYNAKLANNFWNLLNRVIVLALKWNLDNWLDSIIDEKIEKKVKKYNSNFEESIKNYNLKSSIDESFKFLDELNKYIDDWKPWELLKKWWDKDDILSRGEIVKTFFWEKETKLLLSFLKNNNLDWGNMETGIQRQEVMALLNIRIKQIYYTIAEWLRQVWMNLYAFFPEKMWEMFDRLGLDNYSEKLENWELEELRNKKEVFNITEKWKPLFARFDID